MSATETIVRAKAGMQAQARPQTLEELLCLEARLSLLPKSPEDSVSLQGADPLLRDGWD